VKLVPQKTFRDLGIPFPLFDAPTSEAAEYKGTGRCSLCRKEGAHRFELDCADVIVRCSVCAVESELEAHDLIEQTCHACGNRLNISASDQSAEVACYGCLREGRVAIHKDTELGMIRHEDAMRGITHGMPVLDRQDVELVRPIHTTWVCAKLSTPTMLELIRTPTYLTIQGEKWLFCCGGPMVYIGPWSREKFSEIAPDGNGRAFFHQVVDDTIEGLWEDTLHDETGVYVFRCPVCKKYRAHWDLA
jgi:uncharacterized protein CbrC (UPF0167 family)